MLHHHRMFPSAWLLSLSVTAAIMAQTATNKPAGDAPRTPKKPAAPAPVEPQVVNFTTSDGVKIVADFYASRATGDQKSPTAILIHMYPTTRESWKPLVPDFLRAGFAVLAYDIRGAGQSVEPADKGLAKRYTDRDPELFKDAWKDAEAARKWIAAQKNCDADKLVLVGASIGSSIAIDYGRQEQSVKAVVCLSPGLKYMELDTLAHLTEYGRRPSLLIAPKGEYDPIREMIKASKGAAMGKQFNGDQEMHGTNLFNGPQGVKVRKAIVGYAHAQMLPPSEDEMDIPVKARGRGQGQGGGQKKSQGGGKGGHKGGDESTGG